MKDVVEYQYLALEEDAEVYGSDFDEAIYVKVDECKTQEEALKFLEGLKKVYMGHVDYDGHVEELYIKLLEMCSEEGIAGMRRGTELEVKGLLRSAFQLMPLLLDQTDTRGLSRHEESERKKLIEQVKEGWFESTE